MTPAAPLVEVTRTNVRDGSERVESIHTGHLIVLDETGEQRLTVGDASAFTFVRSAAKPFQAQACLELLQAAGEDVTSPELAISWASHVAAEAHLDAVGLLLTRAGVAADDLTCPPDHHPSSGPGGPAERILHNCSGKHAMFALVGARLGYSRDELLTPDGPLQSKLLTVLAEVLGGFGALAVDGCGAPAVASTIGALAAAYGELARGQRWRPVVQAGLRHPVLIGGEDRLESALMARGVVAKLGAEGVYGAAWQVAPDVWWSAAIKCRDGATRGASTALHDVIVAAGGLPEPIWHEPPVLGGGSVAGTIRTADSLRQLLHAEFG